MRLSVLVVGAFVLVAGCANPFSSFAPDEDTIIERTWLTGAEKRGLVPVYCYRTLVKLECFDRPRSNDGRPMIRTYRAATR